MFRKTTVLTLLVLVALLVPASFAQAASPPDRTAHPPIHVHGRATATNPTGYTPGQVRHAYGFDQLSADGSGQVIALVDAYDAPNVAKDLQTFITTFGLRAMNGLPNTPSCTIANGPHPCFQKVYAQAGRIRANSGWALESSLDTQWAHAIAPGADILLVEAKSNSFSDLLTAVDVAASRGAGAVSMSWGGSEFSGESSYDYHFNKSGVVFLASSGDSGSGAFYPAASPYVLGVGGTTLRLDAAGNVLAETAWSGSGGGVSNTEAEPAYQTGFQSTGSRGVPDVAYDADPATGFPVYDSTKYLGQSGWFEVGGTSAGAPQWSALVALANQSRASGRLGGDGAFYAGAGSAVYSADYRDITSGTNGTCGSNCTAQAGYDFVTGLGTPLAPSLIPFLASH